METTPSITYSITGSNAGSFVVNSSGQIQTGRVLNHEAVDRYTIPLQASATGGNDTISVTILVEDINEAPSFPFTITARSVAENSPEGTNVGRRVTATDPEGDTLTYTLSGPTEFEIVSDTGQIRVAAGAVLDYETTDTYTVTVTARDSGNSTGTITVTISLTDVAENSPPVFLEDDYTRTIHENAAPGTPVGAPVQASDPGDTLTYSLSGTDASSFTVDNGTAQLRVASGAVLDYETKTRYSFTITAADPAGSTDSAGVTVNVVDLDEIADLGTVEFVIGCSGTSCGFVQGSYGTLGDGQYPEELFDSGPDRTVLEFTEDADGNWYLRYQGGTDNDWLSDNGALRTILVKVSYEDGRDNREFVLGGFITERQGNNRLQLDPPIISRDFPSHVGETVTVEFLRHVGQAQPAIMNQVTPPNPTANSMVEFISTTTPGGPVVAQYLIVVLVYGVWMWKRSHSTQSLLFGGIILVLTPWVPVIFGMGTVTAAVINFCNILLGAYVYKYFFESKEQYG